MKNLLTKIFFVMITGVLLTACSGETKIYEKYHVFDDMSWNRFDYLDYKVPIEDADAEYDIYVAIRHIPEIPYKEMLINLVIYSPSGSMRASNHTLELVDRDGNSLSKCMGDLCDIVIPIRKGFTVNEPGSVKFEIENKYTKLEMPGIMEVGLIVKKAG